MVMEVTNINEISTGCVLVDFYTSSCMPCKLLNPVLEEISDRYKGLKVAKVEVTKNPDASQRFGVMSVPTVMLLQDAKVKEVAYGFSGKSNIVSMIEKHYAG